MFFLKMPPRRMLEQSESQVRFILHTHTPNQPVSMFLAKEVMRMKQILHEDLTCSICLETICCDKCICVLSCSHHYHFSCIQQNPTGKCPMCRG